MKKPAFIYLLFTLDVKKSNDVPSIVWSIFCAF